MQTVTLVSFFVLAAVVFLTAPPAANAECCQLGVCYDNKLGTPWCGKGSCNIFGCNCDGGCRRPVGKRSLDEEESERSRAYEIVSSGDLNGDGQLSLDEAEAMLEQGPHAEYRRTVRSLDKNMDGMLSVDEIDY